MQEWSVRDVTRTGLYQCKREHCYSSPGHISSLAVSALCQRVCATPGISDFMRPCVTTPTVTDILMLGAGEESYLTSEARWPTELLAIGVDGGGVILLNRYDEWAGIRNGLATPPPPPPPNPLTPHPSPPFSPLTGLPHPCLPSLPLTLPSSPPPPFLTLASLPHPSPSLPHPSPSLPHPSPSLPHPSPI